MLGRGKACLSLDSGPQTWKSNWGKPIPFAPRSLTLFEMEVRRLRLTRERFVLSNVLRGWCQENRNRVYVPEWLLAKWGIEVDVNFSWS
jgi:hypothetical protein